MIKDQHITEPTSVRRKQSLIYIQLTGHKKNHAVTNEDSIILLLHKF
jgi:hypothetical protein